MTSWLLLNTPVITVSDTSCRIIKLSCFCHYNLFASSIQVIPPEICWISLHSIECCCFGCEIIIALDALVKWRKVASNFGFSSTFSVYYLPIPLVLSLQCTFVLHFMFIRCATFIAADVHVDYQVHECSRLYELAITRWLHVWQTRAMCRRE